MIRCGDRLEALAVPGLPLVGRGDDVPALVWSALVAAGMSLADGDVLEGKITGLGAQRNRCARQQDQGQQERAEERS